MSYLSGIYANDGEQMGREDMTLARTVRTIGDLQNLIHGLPSGMLLEMVHPATGLGEHAMLLIPRGENRALLASAEQRDCHWIDADD